MSLLWRNWGARLAAVMGAPYLLGSVPAWASETEVTAQAEEAPVRDYVNLRLGASTGSQRLEMCLEPGLFTKDGRSLAS